MTDEQKNAPEATPEQKPDTGSEANAYVRTKVRRRRPKKFFWNRRDVEEIQASTTAILTADEPGARLRNILMIVTGCLVLAALVLLLCFPPKSNLPRIETLHNDFKRVGVKYTASKVMVDKAKTVQVVLHTVNIANLAPLKGIAIEALYVKNTNVTDITPLQGMPMRCLLLNNTKVSDLSPLQGMPMQFLDFRGTAVTNLTPLAGMSLQFIGFPADREMAGTEVLRRMTSLELINKIPPEEFWPRYDRGEFRASPAAEGGKPSVNNEQ